jgi:hypothetical protein
MGPTCRSNLLQLLGDVLMAWAHYWGAAEQAQIGA